jgi:hypothetical protein
MKSETLQQHLDHARNATRGTLTIAVEIDASQRAAAGGLAESSGIM